MKSLLYFSVLVLILSCSRNERYQETDLSRQVEHFNRKISERAAEYRRITLILDNPTSRAIVFEIDSVRDTLPPLVYREMESYAHKTPVVIYDSAGKVLKDTSFESEGRKSVFVNLAQKKYSVLMKEYKNIDWTFKTLQERTLEELKRTEDAKKPHVWGAVSDSANQFRKPEKIKYVRPSATNEYYEVISYYLVAKIQPGELIVKKFWTLNPEQNFERLQSMEFSAPDKYVRQLVRENELEARKYFGSINTSDFVTAVINDDYLKQMYRTVRMVNTYPKEVLQGLEQENEASKKFVLACKELYKYCKSGNTLNKLTKDQSKLMKKYDLRTLWPACRDSSALVKKHFYREHVKALNKIAEENLF